MKYSLERAKKLIKLAKNAISAEIENKEFEIPQKIKEEFKEPRGVFVSLYVNEELAGCIGNPKPSKKTIAESVINAAKGAAFEDPRFPPIKKEQIKDLRVELTILSEIKPIEVEKPSEYLKKVEIGKDGLMIKEEFGAGILLPQVALEWDWGPKEFLENTCKKAGLSPNCWCNKKRNVYKFQAQVFTEKNGRIVEKKLKA